MIISAAILVSKVTLIVSIFVIFFAGWIAQNRWKKMQERRCVQCRHTRHKRIPKMYKSSDCKTLVEKIIDAVGFTTYSVYVFRRCLHCEHLACRPYDKAFSDWQIRWRERREPDVFKHDPELFIESGIPDPTVEYVPRTKVDEKHKVDPRFQVKLHDPPIPPFHPPRLFQQE